MSDELAEQRARADALQTQVNYLERLLDAREVHLADVRLMLNDALARLGQTPS